MHAYNLNLGIKQALSWKRQWILYRLTVHALQNHHNENKDWRMTILTYN